jgi:hypothetical protein
MILFQREYVSRNSRNPASLPMGAPRRETPRHEPSCQASLEVSHLQTSHRAPASGTLTESSLQVASNQELSETPFQQQGHISHQRAMAESSAGASIVVAVPCSTPTPSAPPLELTFDLIVAPKCHNCRTSNATYAAIPCGCLCLCSIHFHMLQASTPEPKCPSCRQAVYLFQRIRGM